MSSPGIVVMYLWKKYPWTVGWEEADKIPELGGEFIIHCLWINLYNPPRLVDEAHSRLVRCKGLLGDLYEHYEE